MSTLNTESRQTPRNDNTAKHTNNNPNQALSQTIKYESPATISTDDDAAFEKVYSMIVNHCGSAEMNTVHEKAVNLFLDFNNKRVSQLQSLIADSEQVLDTMDSEKSKLKTYIDSLTTEINKEYSTTGTSAPQQRCTVHPMSTNPTLDRRAVSGEPGTSDVLTSRKRRKLEEDRPNSSTITPTIRTNPSQPKIQQYKDSLSQLANWNNDIMVKQQLPLTSESGNSKILQFHTLAWNVFDSDLAVNNHPALSLHRPALNTVALHYNNGMVAPVKRKAKKATEPTIDRPTYDSALMTLMVDGFAESPAIMRNKEMLTFLHSLRSCAPHNLMQSLLEYQPGKKITGLDRMESLCLQELKAKKPHELVLLFHLEIASCKYGVSPKLNEIRSDLPQKFSTSGYISWQLIRAEPDYASRYRMTAKYLQRLKSSKAGEKLCSGNTKEILLRTLQNDGIRAVLEHLLPTNIVKTLDRDAIHQLQPIYLADQAAPQHIYLLGCDMYSLWISIIIFYIEGRLPQQYYTYSWTKKIGTYNLGRFTDDSMLLGIDWTDLTRSPLSTKQQIFVASILLGLLRYFRREVYITDKHGNNMPYLIAIVWNLMGLINQMHDRASITEMQL